MGGTLRRLPFVGPVMAANRQMLFLRILGTLLDRDISLSQALKVVGSSRLDPALDRVQGLRDCRSKVP